ncbi:hypothetical protein QBC37DRAFT_447350 [Rhypophila decipiens]|uniref:Uncharacterized protein n=1 Tax=Rhypophila decipiens TaxID=261697 RepID=A0AAN6Y292_9PEZI|nr:hypothetical protein QBC37DRAFT_447350 [Rhypophila decipiens]
MVGGTPLTSFIASWSAIAGCRGVSAGFSDELASIFFKLATNVKTDFSSTAPMSLLVFTDGDYAVVNLPSLHGDHLSFRTIEFLMHQKDWPILWEPWQPLVAASLELGTFRYGDKPPCGRYACRHVVCIYSFVFFWLTATCEEVRIYLDAKMRYLHLLLANGRINNERYMQRDLFLEAVYSVIRSADDIITLLKAEIRLQPGDSEAAENSDTNRGIWPSDGPGKCFALEGYVYHSTTLLLSYLTIDEWVDAAGIRYEMAHRAWNYVRNHEIMCAFRCAWETVEEPMFGVPVCSHTTAEEIGSYDVEHDSDIDIAESEEETTHTSTLDSDSETSEPSGRHNVKQDSDINITANAEQATRRSTVESGSETSEPSVYHDIEHDSDADTDPNEEAKSTSTVDSDSESDSETFGPPPGMRPCCVSRTVNSWEERRDCFLKSATCPDYSHKRCLIRDGGWDYDYYEIDYQYWFRKYDEVRGVEPYADSDEGGIKGILSSVLGTTRDVLSFIV